MQGSYFKNYNYLIMLGGQRNKNPEKVYSSSLAYNDARSREWGKGAIHSDNEFPIDIHLHYAKYILCIK